MKKTHIWGLLVSAVMLCATVTGCSQGSEKIEGLNDLVLGVGCVLSSGGEAYAEAISDSNNQSKKEYQSGLVAVQELENGGNEDALILDRISAEIYTKMNPDLRIVEPEVGTVPYTIAYKKGNDKLSKLLNENLASLKSDGTLDEILSHWVGASADHVSYVPITEDPKGELIMVTIANLPPFADEEGSAVVGLEPDIMRAICDRLGMSLVIHTVNSTDELYSAIEAGKADVIVSRTSIQKGNITRASFSDSYFDSEQVIVAKS